MVPDGSHQVVLRGNARRGAPELYPAGDGCVLLKVPHGNRYEHYAPTGETAVVEGTELPVFDWVGCTYAAE